MRLNTIFVQKSTSQPKCDTVPTNVKTCFVRTLLPFHFQGCSHNSFENQYDSYLWCQALLVQFPLGPKFCMSHYLLHGQMQ